MDKKRSGRLSLNRETLRRLSARHLGGAAGGTIVPDPIIYPKNVANTPACADRLSLTCGGGGTQYGCTQCYCFKY